MNEQPTPDTYEDIWRKYDAMECRLTASLSERMLDLGKVRTGMRVLDIATGRGEPAIPAAKRVSPNGRVLGIDTDRSMLRLARERAEHEGVTNLELAVGNAETQQGRPKAWFDVVLARWGLMYFEDPVAALRAARRVLKPNGLLVIAVWIEPARASFFELPRTVLARHISIAQIDQDLPGTFYYADADRLAHDLALAGFDIKSSETIEVDVMEATSGSELIAWAQSFGMSRLLHDVSPDAQTKWKKELVAAAEFYRQSDGYIRLGGTSRIVVAS